MLENVPQRLTDYLRGAASDFDRESFYYFAVAYVGLFYLGKNFTKPETSDFLDIQRTNRGGFGMVTSDEYCLSEKRFF
jgi:hypothetical protein